MKKVLVLYKSKTGFSRCYAQWIAEDLQCDLASLERFDKGLLNDYGLIIYGGGLFAGHIRGIARIKRWMKDAPEKTWVVFATGTTPAKESYQELIFKTNFRAGEARPAHFYYFLAGVNYEKMGVFDRLLMRFFSLMDSRKRKTNHPAKQSSIDLTNRVYLEDLLRYVRLKVRQK
ncbi:MAG: flavodoxin domain-containing protein [Syntrophaceae bacterium]|nr:flavodoxin domain-containing protein [Syntrophaceae bacterium]